MMKYQVTFRPRADQDYIKHSKAGNLILLAKIGRLLEELKQNPFEGTGKPHRMKHYPEGENVWSRRIDDRHRMLYTVRGDVVTVFVISLWGHYGDK
jgi:toxin YoeB